MRCFGPDGLTLVLSRLILRDARHVFLHIYCDTLASDRKLIQSQLLHLTFIVYYIITLATCDASMFAEEHDGVLMQLLINGYSCNIHH